MRDWLTPRERKARRMRGTRQSALARQRPHGDTAESDIWCAGLDHRHVCPVCLLAMPLREADEHRKLHPKAYGG